MTTVLRADLEFKIQNRPNNMPVPDIVNNKKSEKSLFLIALTYLGNDIYIKNIPKISIVNSGL